MKTIIETAAFTRQITKLLDECEHDELIDFLSRNPSAGEMIRGAGGVRKIRWAAKGKGKRGGIRCATYFWVRQDMVFALAAYAKNVKADLHPEEKEAMKAFVKALDSL